MINYQPYPTEVISIVSPRDAQADQRTRVDRLRARFARNEGLPFADVLTEARIHDALDEHGVRYRDRLFSPVTTIWGFLSQVLNDDHSCRDAMTRIIAHRAANGLGTCSPNTASYCNARGRLPTGVLCTLAKRTARELQAATAEEWKWNGRSVFIADGSHISMPDTPENQAVYHGRGFLEAFRPGRHFQDTRVARLYEGTDEILTFKIAAAVLGRTMRPSGERQPAMSHIVLGVCRSSIASRGRFVPSPRPDRRRRR
jgi:hypothetical protein